MTRKKQRIEIGKRIRRGTGLPLPICMAIGKHIFRAMLIPRKFQQFVRTEFVEHSCECCGPQLAVTSVVGPKGTVEVAAALEF